MINKLKHIIFVERTHGIVGNGPVLEFNHNGVVKTHMFMPLMPYVMKNPSLVFVRENEDNGKVYLISSEEGTMLMYDTFRNEFKLLRGLHNEWPWKYGPQTCVKFDDQTLFMFKAGPPKRVDYFRD